MKKFPYLLRALNRLVAPDGQALCFHWSAALVLDIPGSELVVGDLNGGAGHMLHAWVEHRGSVYSPSMIKVMGGLGSLDLEAYYNVNDVHVLARMPYRDVMKLMNTIGFQAQLRTGKPLKGKHGERFAAEILEALNVPYMDDGNGALLPVHPMDVGIAA